MLDSDVADPATGAAIIKGPKGSADRFGDTPPPNTGKFLVHFFAKDCGVLGDDWKDKCSPTHGVDPEMGDPALRGMFYIIGLRDYIATDTRRGPDTTQLLTAEDTHVHEVAAIAGATPAIRNARELARTCGR